MRILIVTTLFFVGCTYDAPLNPNAEAPDNVIAGTLVANGVEEPGDVMVLVFDADDPPPPTGTGSPITFSTVPAHEFSDLDGIPSAPFAVGQVPDGAYLVTALMDMDGDFHPLVSTLSGATCGDVLGAHLTDLQTGEYAEVVIHGGELVDNVTVVIGTELTTERPAFELAADAIMDRESVDTQVFSLAATGVHTQTLDLDGPFTGLAPCETYFLIDIVDADGDGAPDEHPDFPGVAGAYDIWPRIYVAYAGEVDEGESWAGQSLIYASPYLNPADPGYDPIALNTLTPRNSLTAVWVPAAQHTFPDESIEIVTDPTSLPAGGWAITVISLTGQTWTIPNTIATETSTDENFDPLGQAGALIVQ